MSHCIQAFIGREAELRLMAQSYRSAFVISLDQGFAILPLTKELFDELGVANGNQQEVQDERFLYLCSRTFQAGQLFSQKIPTAYVETDYFGGSGSQGAAVWANGELIFRPAGTEEGVDNPSETVINAALQKIGVVKGNCLDEFEAVGLGTHRSNEDWIDTQRRICRYG